MEVLEPEIDVDTQQIILAAAHHDLPALRTLLRSASANVQDDETGYTPLHAAIAACAPADSSKSLTNGSTSSQINGAAEQSKTTEEEDDMQAAEKTLKLLFQNGAIWNDLDANGETPGCLAWRLKLLPLYEVVVDAGVRAELLLGRLDEYLTIDEDEDEEEEEEEEDGDNKEVDYTHIEGQDDPQKPRTAESGVEIVIEPPADDPSANNADYLNSQLSFSASRLLDSGNNGVMMDWETEIMQRSASLLLPEPGLTILNIGHGMGIVDGFIQEHSPASHHIIEAHPQVLEKMKQSGWMNKPNVIVHEGRWEDVLPRLVEQGDVTFDAIYFDTFAEDYKAFRNLFNEYVIALLKSDGQWSFFHGLGADRQVCYDVYTKVVEMDLFEAGFDVEWQTVDVPDLQQRGEWDGVKRSYWKADKYRLPLCRFVG